jgi:squalene cyclase
MICILPVILIHAGSVKGVSQDRVMNRNPFPSVRMGMNPPAAAGIGPRLARTLVRAVSVASALAIVAASAPACHGEAAAPPPPPLTVPDYPPHVAAAVDKGLQWLAQHQKRDGSFGTSVPVATTGLAGLAFLAHGDVPGRGAYAEQVSKSIHYLLSRQMRSGYITEDPGHGSSSRMHGHGYATLFLGEVLGTATEGTDSLRSKLAKAVHVIEYSQSKDGGWYYEPEPTGDEASITVTQVQALRSARNAGLRVNKPTIDRAIQYIKRCVNPDGSVRYSLSHNQTYSSFTLTAAGVSVMDYLGEYKIPEVQKGLRFLIEPFARNAKRPGPPDGCDFLSYQEFYALLAFYLAGDDPWCRYGSVIRGEILRRQVEDGSWPECSYGPEINTAFATLTLQITKQYLPIFQR